MNAPEVPETSDPADEDRIERLRETCPVRREHKSMFPAPPWRWQPGAASWVWAVLKEAGGSMEGAKLIERLAELRGWSRRQANGLRNQGLFVLEAFGLVQIERIPAPGGRSTARYGLIEIVAEEIPESTGERRER